MLSIAGTAHWQAGKVERHNQIAKDMIQKIRNHTQTKGEQAMKEMAVKISHAKNSLVREHGWSPNTSVFGREPRVFGGLLQQGTPPLYHPDVGNPKKPSGPKNEIPISCQAGVYQIQAKHMLGKAVHARTRKIPQPQIGQLVFF